MLLVRLFRQVVKICPDDLTKTFGVGRRIDNNAKRGLTAGDIESAVDDLAQGDVAQITDGYCVAIRLRVTRILRILHSWKIASQLPVPMHTCRLLFPSPTIEIVFVIKG